MMIDETVLPYTGECPICLTIGVSPVRPRLHSQKGWGVTNSATACQWGLGSYTSISFHEDKGSYGNL
jgi:hypothetical protein